jgi:hypothetical protein
MDWAEIGRSGSLAAIAARRCAAIASRTETRPLNAPGFDLDTALVVLDTDEAIEPAFGLLGSFCSSPFDLASRLSMMLDKC